MVVPYIQCNSGLHTVRLFNVCCHPCPDQKEYIPAMMLCFYSLSSRVCVYLSSNHKLSKQYKGKFICINNPQSLCLPKQSISRCQSNQFMITPWKPTLECKPTILPHKLIAHAHHSSHARHIATSTHTNKLFTPTPICSCRTRTNQALSILYTPVLAVRFTALHNSFCKPTSI